jgi:hypothetical protein
MPTSKPSFSSEEGAVRFAQFRRLQHLFEHQSKVGRLGRVLRESFSQHGEHTNVISLLFAKQPDFLLCNCRFQRGFLFSALSRNLWKGAF